MKDLTITSDGDLDFSLLDTDLGVVEGDDYRVQMAFCRIKSIKQDWYLDNIGTDLEEILGMPNTKDVRSLGINKMINVLTDDNLYTLEEVYIETSIVDAISIKYDVYLRNLDQVSATLLKVQLDLIKGVSIGGSI